MTADILSLIDKAKQSLKAAKLLLNDSYFDFASSRAYYAMFYVAEALLTSLGKSYSSHSALQAAFGLEFAKTGKLNPKFHRWLLDAQDLRNTGDYGIGTNLTRKQAEEICGWAREFIEAAEIYLNA
jgi:uncharacterized protein (UPF0332 family)